MRVVTSVVERDGLGTFAEGTSPLAAFARALDVAGLRLIEHRAVAAADMPELETSWSKRLGIPARRPAWLLTARHQSTAMSRPSSGRNLSVAPTGSSRSRDVERMTRPPENDQRSSRGVLDRFSATMRRSRSATRS